MSFIRYCLVSFVLVCSWSLVGQSSFRIAPGVIIGDTSQVHELILVDYSTILGTALALNGEFLTFKLRDVAEPNRVPVAKIRYLDAYFEAGGIRQRGRRVGKSVFIDFTDPTYHRTALPWTGRGRVRVTNVLYSVVEWNANDYFQFGIGTTLFFGVLTTQKLRFSVNDQLHFGVSNQALYPILLDAGLLPLVGDVAGNVTFGNAERYASLGAGFLYSTDSSLRPTHLNFSGGARVGRNWHVYGEVSIIDDRFDTIVLPAFSAAHSVRRHRWRYGFFNVLTPFGSVIPLPLIGYEYHW